MSTGSTTYTVQDACERITNLTFVSTATTHATVNFYARSASEALGYVWSKAGFGDEAGGYVGKAQQKMADLEFDYPNDADVWLAAHEVTEVTDAAREALRDFEYAIAYETRSRAQPAPDSQQE